MVTVPASVAATAGAHISRAQTKQANKNNKNKKQSQLKSSMENINNPRCLHSLLHVHTIYYSSHFIYDYANQHPFAHFISYLARRTHQGRLALKNIQIHLQY